MEVQQLIAHQQNFFNTNETKNIQFRIAQLKKLKQLLKDNESALFKAIYDDFGKSEFETYVSELSLVYNEINMFISKIKKWSTPKKVATGFANFPAKSYIIPEPLGVILVIGAWNYPYQLSLIPAISALAAGNTVILKPSELPKHTSQIMAKLINEAFDRNYFLVVEGGVQETTALLEHRFDKIFFTGSTPVGKIIYQAAAKHLTPVTLELGGKSPTFIFADANLKRSAQRIVWAKFLNAGQTCVAPDYILVEKQIEKQFLEVLKQEIIAKFETDLSVSDNYVSIINSKNFDRLTQLIPTDKVYYGGNYNQKNRIISPTILANISFEDTIMKDEIFGPILPVISFENLDDVVKKVKANPKPLSCYIYSNNKKTIQKLLSEISFGGGAVNDSVMHLSNSNLPFGGVGLSGIGSYHGKTGFDAFTHYKSILEKPFWFEANFKYAPYSAFKLKVIKWLFE